MIWVVFALMTGATVFGVLWPLSRSARRVTGRDKDIAFYEAQIAEIQRDLDRGLTSRGDAESAQTQAARRLLGAAQSGASAAAASPTARRIAAIAAILVIPAVSFGLYSLIGNPSLPDEPLAARLSAPPGKLDVNVVLAKIEQHLIQNPNDGRGWELIAPVYLRLGEPNKAAHAYAEAIRTLGDTSDRETALGTALVYAQGGQVSDRARKAFETAQRLDPKAPGPQFYLGVAAQQDGQKDQAIKIWDKLLASSPPNAPWTGAVRARLASISGKPPPPPAAAAAIAALPASQQAAAIQRMVDRLAANLKKNGADVDGWLRLVRAYVVLHESNRARKALADARQSLSNDSGGLARLDVLARQLGLGN